MHKNTGSTQKTSREIERDRHKRLVIERESEGGRESDFFSREVVLPIVPMLMGVGSRGTKYNLLISHDETREYTNTQHDFTTHATMN